MKEKVNFQVLESYLDEYKLEYSLIGANFKDKDIEVAEIATYWTICLEKNLRYVEEQVYFVPRIVKILQNFADMKFTVLKTG